MKSHPLSLLNNVFFVLLLTCSSIVLAAVESIPAIKDEVQATEDVPPAIKDEVQTTEDNVVTTQTGEEQHKPDEDKINPLDKVEVNIIKRNNNTIETHSINGVIYEVKIKPDNAPAYYLYDTDGDGTLETRSEKKFSDITVQQWKIFEW